MVLKVSSCSFNTFNRLYEVKDQYHIRSGTVSLLRLEYLKVQFKACLVPSLYENKVLSSCFLFSCFNDVKKKNI